MSRFAVFTLYNSDEILAIEKHAIVRIWSKGNYSVIAYIIGTNKKEITTQTVEGSVTKILALIEDTPTTLKEQNV